LLKLVDAVRSKRLQKRIWLTALLRSENPSKLLHEPRLLRDRARQRKAASPD
jgi:hypothetical protein